MLDGEIHVVAQVGDRVLLGGNFTQVRDAGDTVVVDQAYLVSYHATTGLIDTGWAPDLNGEVRAIAVEGDGTTVFVGGEFTFVDGTERDHLAALFATDGSLDHGFTIGANAKVTALAVSGDRLYVGTMNGAFRVGEDTVELAVPDPRVHQVTVGQSIYLGTEGGLAVFER